MIKLLAITTLFILPMVSSAQALGQDFNYSFTPNPRYSMETKVQVLDSASNKVYWKQDTTSRGLAIFVKKEGNEFTIGNLFAPTSVVYKEQVVFKGLGAPSSLVYESTKESKERVVVNPIAGTVEITFFNCEKNTFAKSREDCNRVIHLFGIAPTQKP